MVFAPMHFCFPAHLCTCTHIHQTWEEENANHNRNSVKNGVSDTCPSAPYMMKNAGSDWLRCCQLWLSTCSLFQNSNFPILNTNAIRNLRQQKNEVKHFVNQGSKSMPFFSSDFMKKLYFAEALDFNCFFQLAVFDSIPFFSKIQL